MIRFTDGDYFFEIDVAMMCERAPYSLDDVLITLRMSSHGYSGRNEVWVIGRAFEQFCTALVALERTLKGEAVLTSLTPDELNLRMYAASSRGRLAVSCSTGYTIQGEDLEHFHSVTIGFEFEPGQLVNAINKPWVRKYAG